MDWDWIGLLIFVLAISGMGCLALAGFLWKHFSINEGKEEKKNSFTTREASYIFVPVIVGAILLTISHCIGWYGARATYFGRPATVEYLDVRQIYRIDGQVETSACFNIVVLENAEGTIYCVITNDPVPATSMPFVRRINDEIFSVQSIDPDKEP